MADARPVEFFDPQTDIGRSYAAVDWSRTPIGEPGQWPESLRAAFSMMVSSRFAMWMAWGPELTFFCNDTYRRETLGAQVPLGARPAGDRGVGRDLAGHRPAGRPTCWPGEADLGRGAAAVPRAQRLPRGDYHTFSYSPLVGDDATIAGMLCVVSEDTGRVLGQRRIAALRDLASGLADASAAEIFAAAEARLPHDPYDLPFSPGTCSKRRAGRRRPAGRQRHPGRPPPPRRPPRPPARRHPVGDAGPPPGRTVVVDDLGTLSHTADRRLAVPPRQAPPCPLRTGGDGRAGFLVVGLNRYRAGRRRRTGASSSSSPGSSPPRIARGPRLRGRARARRAAGRARPGQDDVLHQRQPRAAHAADAAARPGRGRAGRHDRRRCRPRSASASRSSSATPSGCSSWSTRCSTSPAWSRDDVEARFEPVDLGRFTAELASMFESASTGPG